MRPWTKTPEETVREWQGYFDLTHADLKYAAARLVDSRPGSVLSLAALARIEDLMKQMLEIHKASEDSPLVRWP